MAAPGHFDDGSDDEAPVSRSCSEAAFSTRDAAAIPLAMRASSSSHTISEATAATSTNDWPSEDEDAELEALTSLWQELRLENTELHAAYTAGLEGIQQMGSLCDELSGAARGVCGDASCSLVSPDLGVVNPVSTPGVAASVSNRVPAGHHRTLSAGKRERFVSAHSLVEPLHPRKQLSNPDADGQGEHRRLPLGRMGIEELKRMIEDERKVRRTLTAELEANAARIAELTRVNAKLKELVAQAANA